MEGLSQYNACWEPARVGVPGRVWHDDRLVLATDFEGGNGTDLRALAADHYAVRLEPEPGQHPFSGKAYYFCFGVRNLSAESRIIRVRLEATSWECGFREQTRHVVLRRGGDWFHLKVDRIHPVDGEDAVDVELTLPAGTEQDPVLFVSNFHWWPFSEFREHLSVLKGGEGVRVRDIGRSFQQRPIYAVEVGRDDVGAPTIVNAQTPQPSEMGSLACRHILEFLRSDDPVGADICRRFRLCFLPMTNPDGTVLGYGVSDAQGHFPFFEADRAAAGDPSATPENLAVWQYLQRLRPLLFLEWHSNNWSRRPGHMLIRYAHDLVADVGLRRTWDVLEERLLALPDTHHGSWTSWEEGLYQSSMGFQVVTRLGGLATMIKQHDKFPLEQSKRHAAACLRIAADTLTESVHE